MQKSLKKYQNQNLAILYDININKKKMAAIPNLKCEISDFIKCQRYSLPHYEIDAITDIVQISYRSTF